MAASKKDEPHRAPEILRILGTVVVFFVLEYIRPDGWVDGIAELPVFLIEALIGMYVVDGLWMLRRRLRREHQPTD